MATIQLNNDDLRFMIQEAVSRLCEGQWYEAEPLCRLPYFVMANFSDHAIDRENERDINEKDIIENLKLAVKDIINDYSDGKISENDYVKVIDQDSCIVAVCGIHPSFNKKRIHQLVVVTTYIWDGKINIDKGNNYYVNEPSDEYIAAKEWNEENQDKVVPYMEWKRDSDIARQQRKADREYYWRTHPQEPSDEKRWNRVNQTYDRYERKQRQDIHDALPDGDLKAIQDYFRNMDKGEHIKLEPLEEIVRRAVKQAVHESLRIKTSKRSSKN